MGVIPYLWSYLGSSSINSSNSINKKPFGTIIYLKHTFLLRNIPITTHGRPFVFCPIDMMWTPVSISFVYWLLFYLESSQHFFWILDSDLFGLQFPLYLDTSFLFIWKPVSISFGYQRPIYLDAGFQKNGNVVRFNLDSGFENVFQNGYLRPKILLTGLRPMEG